MEPAIQLRVNGENLQLAAGVTVTQLLDRLKHSGRRLAVEHNGEILPRSRHAETVLAEGDRVEIIHAIGGG